MCLRTKALTDNASRNGEQLKSQRMFIDNFKHAKEMARKATKEMLAESNSLETPVKELEEAEVEPVKEAEPITEPQDDPDRPSMFGSLTTPAADNQVLTLSGRLKKLAANSKSNHETMKGHQETLDVLTARRREMEEYLASVKAEALQAAESPAAAAPAATTRPASQGTTRRALAHHPMTKRLSILEKCATGNMRIMDKHRDYLVEIQARKKAERKLAEEAMRESGLQVESTSFTPHPAAVAD